MKLKIIATTCVELRKKIIPLSRNKIKVNFLEIYKKLANCPLKYNHFQETSFQSILSLLEKWTNNILYEDNIRITSLKSDFNDGVVFKKIVEKLQGCEIKLPLSEDVQAKERQMKNLSAILDEISNIVGKSAISDDSGIPVYVRAFF